jgi:endonuclease YncB( thermonuclease family)
MRFAWRLQGRSLSSPRAVVRSPLSSRYSIDAKVQPALDDREWVWKPATHVLLAFALLLVPSLTSAQLVTKVVDGDTLIVQGVGTVRLIGVDTPETVDPREPVQPFGKEAIEFTRRMAEGKVVRLDFDWQREDKYDRTLAYVYLPDGSFLNAEIIKQGYGHAYTEYPFRYPDQFRAYEREAREAGRGLWGATNPVQLASAENGQEKVDPEQIVYVTRTGTKYHRSGCRSLSRSQVPIALKNVGSYGACSICRPPVLTGTTAKIPAVVQASPRSQPRTTQRASSGRCQATTKKGTQCSRKAQAGSSYCWQHSR